MRVYLLLGSNIEPRITFIENATRALSQKVGTILAESSLYETAAWGKEDQSNFINKAVCLETHLLPEALLSSLKKMETDLGRKERETWGKREIDIDILLVENFTFFSKTLTIPHPYLHERNFALQPLLEIAPKAVHPIFKKTISEIATDCKDLKRVSKIS
jgi:2-amino-4-hydroxy-6-hydroxymethyldihydropteridine diphosphokinase